jgi:diguanylate cyclase (GGDEF)-like protein/PAS domain S-box-containing protein
MSDVERTMGELLTEVRDLRGMVEALRLSEQRLKQTEESLRESEARYRDLFENVNDLIQCVNPEGRFVYVNRAWKETLGYSDHDIEGLTLFEILDPSCRQHCLDVFRRLMSGEKIERVEVTFLGKGGRKVVLEGSVNTRSLNGTPESTRGIFRDITERKQLEEELRAVSLRDELTGMYNRRGFLTLAEQQKKTARRLNKRLALIYGDLDGLKGINDMHGHREGDRALADAARMLRGSVRESDLVARIGGDEFGILVMIDDDADAEEILVRVHDHIADFNTAAGRPYALAISTGISLFDDDCCQTVEAVLALADDVMYREKRRRRGTHEKGGGPLSLSPQKV